MVKYPFFDNGNTLNVSPRSEAIRAYVGGKLLARQEAKVSVFNSVVQGGNAVCITMREITPVKEINDREIINRYSSETRDKIIKRFHELIPQYSEKLN